MGFALKQESFFTFTVQKQVQSRSETHTHTDGQTDDGRTNIRFWGAPTQKALKGNYRAVGTIEMGRVPEIHILECPRLSVCVSVRPIPLAL